MTALKELKYLVDAELQSKYKECSVCGHLAVPKISTMIACDPCVNEAYSKNNKHRKFSYQEFLENNRKALKDWADRRADRKKCLENQNDKQK